MDVSNSSKDISGGLGSLDAFSRLGSLVKSPQRTLKELLGPLGRTPLGRTLKDPRHLDDLRTRLPPQGGSHTLEGVHQYPRGPVCMSVCATACMTA